MIEDRIIDTRCMGYLGDTLEMQTLKVWCYNNECQLDCNDNSPNHTFDNEVVYDIVDTKITGATKGRRHVWEIKC